MNKLILGLAVVLSSAFVHAQVDRTKVPTPGPAPEIKINDPVVFDLDNGMKVILSPNNKIPKVSFNLVMGSDPRLEGGKAGLSSMLGSLLLSGTENRTKDEIDLEKDFIGASLYASSNSLYLSVLTKHMDKGLDLFTDVMKNANFPQSEFDRIKKQQESGLHSAKSDPNSMIRNAVSKAIFTDNHPYGEVMTEETLENITRDDVVDLYNKQFTPQGSYLVIVGDIDVATAKKIANDRFGKWTGGAPFKAEYHHGVLPKGNRVIFVEKAGSVQSDISIALPIDMLPGDDNQIKLQVMNRLLGGGGFGTRLMQNLREDKAFTYGAYSVLNIDRKGSYLYTNGSFRNEVTDSAIVEFLYEFNRLVTDLPTQEELALNKATMAGGFARSLESPRTVADFALNTYRNNLDADYYQTYLQRLNAVNDVDVLTMGKSYIDPNALTIVVVGNKEVLESLRKFDADGEIELFDPFGNPAVEKTYLPSPISKEEILKNYLMAVTQTKDYKKAEKKINKLKTLKTEMKIQIDGSPMEMNLVEYFKAPNMSRTEMTFSGMPIQQEIFNGKAGMSKTMNQTGGFDTKELTEEEVSNKRKLAAVFSEYSLLSCHVDEIELLGIEEREGKDDLFVLKYKIGDGTFTDHYSTKTFLKISSDRLEVTEEGPQAMTTIYSGYTNYKGYLLPASTSQLIASVTMSAKIVNVEVNKKIDDKKFELK